MRIHLFGLLGGAAALLALPAGALGIADWAVEPGHGPATVTVAARPIDYVPPGEYLAGGRAAPAPAERLAFDRPLEIMAHQVSLAEYRLCVAAGACQPADAPAGSPEDGPVTGVSHIDATAYAGWLSRRTGETWRLPTDAEWVMAAGERFAGDLFIEADDPANPAVAWLRRYREEAERRRQRDPEPKPAGFYGPNSHGVFDMGGNVWEWTSTCYVRATLSADGERVETAVENCGVHVMEGRHRAYMSNFIRDGKSGGCAVGTPPENLGFRLVRERPPLVSLAGLRHRLRSTLTARNGVAVGD